MSIIKEIISGFEKSPKLKVIVNRKDAISFCLEEISNKEDECVLLVAGKGHEDYQEISNERFYFNDSEEIKKYLENLKSRSLACLTIVGGKAPMYSQIES